MMKMVPMTELFTHFNKHMLLFLKLLTREQFLQMLTSTLNLVGCMLNI